LQLDDLNNRLMIAKTVPQNIKNNLLLISVIMSEKHQNP